MGVGTYLGTQSTENMYVRWPDFGDGSSLGNLSGNLNLAGCMSQAFNYQRWIYPQLECLFSTV